MPSTAEIIQVFDQFCFSYNFSIICQKCLSVNPFDLKFREANQQINGRIGQSDHLLSPSGTLPTTSGSVINSKNNLSTKCDIRTWLDVEFPPDSALTVKHPLPGHLFQHQCPHRGYRRRTQENDRFIPESATGKISIEMAIILLKNEQGDDGWPYPKNQFLFKLRENGLLSKQEDGQLKTPCTSDVLNAVLDMHMSGATQNQLGPAGSSSPFISSTSLLAGLNGLKAALNSSVNTSASQGGIDEKD